MNCSRLSVRRILSASFVLAWLLALSGVPGFAAPAKKKSAEQVVRRRHAGFGGHRDGGEDSRADQEIRPLGPGHGDPDQESTGPSDKEKTYSSMVYSNGTGIYFDPDTRMEIRKFVQEPFTPNRADMETEPSISQTPDVSLARPRRPVHQSVGRGQQHGLPDAERPRLTFAVASS